MADDVDPESKTEEATPRRREEARRKGQIPFSAELVGSLVLLSGVIGLIYLGPAIWAQMTSVFRHEIPRAYHTEFGTPEATELLARTTLRVLGAMASFFGVLMAVGFAASVLQVGLQLNTERLELNFDKLNPANGFQKLFSMTALVRGGLMILKVLALAGVGYWVVSGRAGVIMSLGTDRLARAATVGWAMVMRLALYLVGAVVLVALLDYIWQRRKFEQNLRMTKEEVKREMKEDDGDPEIKARIRQLQRERSKRKMLAEIPKATVVVTNPTHYAVALRYNPDRDAAPVVVARGTGPFALKIAELARRSGVVILERPPLARALYTIKEGQAIPGQLFRAVAEVLAFVFRVRGGWPGGTPA